MNKILDIKNNIRLWIFSYLRLVTLNWPYVRARLLGYKYYIEVRIDINPQPFRKCPSRGVSLETEEVEEELAEIGARVLFVRRVKRRNRRSSQWRLFAVFKDEESAILFKLQEGGGNLQKFKPWISSKLI